MVHYGTLCCYARMEAKVITQMTTKMIKKIKSIFSETSRQVSWSSPVSKVLCLPLKLATLELFDPGLCFLLSESWMAAIDAFFGRSSSIAKTSEEATWIAWTFLVRLNWHNLTNLCRAGGTLPSRWYIIRLTIVATRTSVIMISVAIINTPSKGMLSDVSGSDEGISSRNTIMPSRRVVIKPILSPLSEGMKKLARARKARISPGEVR